MKGDIPNAAIRVMMASRKVRTHRRRYVEQRGWQSVPREPYNARWLKPDSL